MSAPSPLFFVFLDTQVFRKERFDWDASNFRALYRRVQTGSVEVLTTDILRGELRRQASMLHNEFVQAVSKAESLSAVPRLLKQIPADGLKGLMNRSLDQREVNQAADKLLSWLQAENVPIPEDVLPELFKTYFDGEAPFGVKGKKSEFPDAVNMFALKAFSHDNNVKVHIVSEDGDWARICEKHDEFILFERIEQFLDMAVRSEFASSQFWSNDEILERLNPHKEELRSQVFLDLSIRSRVNMGDGNLDSLVIRDFYLEDILVTDIRTTQQGLRCLGELAVEVRFEAEMSLDDPELANVLYGQTEGDVSLLGTISFDMDLNDPKLISNIRLSLDEGLELEVPLAY